MSPNQPYRICPRCHGHRSVTELLCQARVADRVCGWNLSGEEIIESSSVLEPTITVDAAATDSGRISGIICRNGHACSEGDLICAECGVELHDHKTESDRWRPSQLALVHEPDEPAMSTIGNWTMVRELPSSPLNNRRFVVRRSGDRTDSLLTVYRNGRGLETDVENVLTRKQLESTLVPSDAGECNGERFVVCELPPAGSLRNLRMSRSDLSKVEEFVEAFSMLLLEFSDLGLRHRQLTPETVWIRSLSPLKLAASDFSSARLSGFDLKFESPLDAFRHMAPEILTGAVSAASDWWAMGIILLDLLSKGECFSGAESQLFLMHVQSTGVPIPDEYPPRLILLLRGLLTVDRSRRWQWAQVDAWLRGEDVPDTATSRGAPGGTAGSVIALGGRTYTTPKSFALAAFRSDNWDEAVSLVERGGVTSWARRLGLDATTITSLDQLTSNHEITSDFRLALVIQLLDRGLPLVHRGSIVSPAWLEQDENRAFELISGPVPRLQQRFDLEPDSWLQHLAKRLRKVQQLAADQNVQLSETELRRMSLKTNRSDLMQAWIQRRTIWPDSNIAALQSIISRRYLTNEDLLLLLAASISQFRTVDEIISSVQSLAADRQLEPPSQTLLRSLLCNSRDELYARMDLHLDGLARCGVATFDDWADEYRRQTSLDIEPLLMLLAVPSSSWVKPHYHQYVKDLLSFFERKVSASVLRGPLVRMSIGKTTPRVDLTELAAEIAVSEGLLQGILERHERKHPIQTELFEREPNPAVRLRRLQNHTQKYLRDTGLNGLYLGFPFLLLNDRPSYRKPRLAPVLLWPVKLDGSPGGYDTLTLAFDTDRDEVRLNPAFEGLLGRTVAREWAEAAQSLLRGPAFGPSAVMNAFGLLAPIDGHELRALPVAAAFTESVATSLIPSAVLFHMEFIGQSLIEDLRALPGREIEGTALETMLRTTRSPNHREPAEKSQSSERMGFHVESIDPSQERAIATAFESRGVVIQGPPGTGKSQTIVNLVSDAIGRGKTVLVVCQKLPALEVVRKRLVAVGLKDRICLITDINKDQREIRQQISVQVRELLRPDVYSGIYSEMQRETLLTKISRLEQDIDNQHQAMIARNDRYDSSYTSIIDELLDFEEGVQQELPDLGELVRFLRGTTTEKISILEDTCDQLGTLWCRSQFESSPFREIDQLEADDLAVREFIAGLQQLVAAEERRCRVLLQSTDYLTVQDAEGTRAWLQHNRYELFGLSNEARETANKCLPHFLNGGPGHLLLAATSELCDLLSTETAACQRLPELQAVIGEFGDEDFREHAEFCALHAQPWLDSHFSVTPFQFMRKAQFTADSLADFQKCLDNLEYAERQRADVYSQEYAFPELARRDTAERWLQQYEELLSEITVESARTVAIYFGLFQGESKGKALIEAIQRFQQIFQNVDLSVLGLPGADAAGLLVERDQLADWYQWSAALSTNPHWSDFLRLPTLLARRRAGKLLASLGIECGTNSILAFGRAVRIEQQCAEIRKRWPLLWPPGEPGGFWRGSLSSLKAEIESALRILTFVESVTAALATCPLPLRIQPARLDRPQSFISLIRAVRLALQRYLTRDASLKAIDSLHAWMQTKWCRAANEVVNLPGEVDAKNCICQLLQARATMVPLLQIRAALSVKPPHYSASLEAMERLRETAVREGGRKSLSRFVRSAMRYNWLIVRLGKLKSQLPDLLTELPISLDQHESLLKRLQGVADLSSRLDGCAFTTSLRQTGFSKDRLLRLFLRLDAGIQVAVVRSDSLKQLAHISQWMSTTWVSSMRRSIEQNQSKSELVLPLRDALPTLPDFLAFRLRWEQLDSMQRQMFEKFAAFRNLLDDIEQEKQGTWLRDQLRRACLLTWKTTTERDHPELLTRQVDVQKKIEVLQETLGELKRIDREHLAQSYNHSALGTWSAWQRALSAKTGSLRSLLGRQGESLGLRNLRPVWLMIPTAVSQVLPLDASLFDMVIFDEASQMPVEHALPSLYRASTVVVSGDDKQMPPASFFSNRIRDDDADDEPDEEEEADEQSDSTHDLPAVTEITNCPDLLHLADNVLPQSTLQIHYRSRYRELIAFSNAAFYENKLSIPVFHAEQKVKSCRPVEFITVKGVYSSQTNLIEAERVVECLTKLWSALAHQRPSVGIVTFNRKQADLIEDLLEKKAESTPKFREVLAAERQRIDDGENVSLFVKNVENVQGDERDLIIFSTTFGPDARGVFRRNFGVLGQSGGERRLNVAVTRAKTKIIVVCSMPLESICDRNNRLSRPQMPREFLQDYLQYVRLISDGNPAQAKQILERMSVAEQHSEIVRRRSDGLRKSVGAYLSSLGYIFERPDADPVLGIDFAVLDPVSREAVMGIDCTPREHVLLSSARMRELWRVSLLNRLYRRFIRISPREWYQNRDAEKARLAAELRAQVGESR
jgi:serine/threonine protein kinase